MVENKKKDTKDLFKAIAKANNISVTELKKEIQLAIEIAQNNPDSKKQTEFRKYFGDRTPTPEEFVYVLTKEITKDQDILDCI